MAGETTTTALSDQVTTRYDVVARMALRSIPLFAQFATVKAQDPTNPGTPTTFHIWSDLATQTSTLNEVTDVTPVALSSGTVSVTPAEKGMTTVDTAKLRADTMLPGYNADRANIVGYNMARSVDELARIALDGTTNVNYAGAATSVATVAATHVLTADKVRQNHATLKAANVMKIGGSYVALVDPFVGYDLRSETGDGSWLWPSQYVNTERIWEDEIGKFGGFKFIETDLANLQADAGVGSTVDVYSSYFLGAECLAQAISIPTSIVPGPITDYLRRLVPLGWYGYFGFDTFRDEAALITYAASSMGANT